MEHNKFRINPFHAIGVLHNKGLDFVLAKIGSSDSEEKGDEWPEIEVEEIIGFTAEFMVSLHKEGVSDPKIDYSTDLRYAIYFKHIAQTIIPVLEEEPVDKILERKDISGVSKYIIKEILAIPLNLEYQETIERFNEIERKIAEGEKAQMDKEMLQPIVSIGKESFKHSFKLQERRRLKIMGREIALDSLPDKVHAFWQADVLGGINAFGTEILVGFFGSPVPVGIITLATSISSSACSLLEPFLNFRKK